MAKKVKLGFIRSLAINITFSVLAEVVDIIEDDLWRKWAKSHIEPLRELIDILTDKNPDNKKQLEDLFKQHGKEYIIDQLSFAVGIIDRYVKNESSKALIIATLDSLIKEVQGQNFIA